MTPKFNDLKHKYWSKHCDTVGQALTLECLGSSPQSAPIQLPAHVYAGRWQVIAKVLGSLPLLWKVQMEFWAPGFSPDTAVTGIWAVNQQVEEFSFSLSLCFSNKQKD